MSRYESRLDKELRFHLEQRTADLIAGGCDPAEARRLARIELDGLEQVKEGCRDEHRMRWFEDLWRDTIYALRTLRQKPGFASAAILSLALGIGANTAIFSLIDAVILKSLPVRHPEELVQVTMGNDYSFTNPTWEHLRDRQDVFSGIFAYSRWEFNLSPGGEAHPVNGVYVSGSYFDTLGVHAAIGRTLVPADDTRGCPGIAVISYGLWQREYGGRSDILGKTISVDRHPIEIVGVTESGFQGVEVGASADVMAPLCSITLIGAGYPRMLESNFYPVGWLQVIGRLKPGVSESRAAARLKWLAPHIYKGAFDERGLVREDGRQSMERNKSEYLHRTFAIESAANGISYIRREYRTALTVLMSIVALVLLIACGNVADLLIARGAARQREIAIRIAIGCGRGRIIRQFLTESLLLSGIGAMLGILFAPLGARALVWFLDASLDLTVDIRILAFTAMIALLTGLLFGLAPALRATRVDPQWAMKAAARGVVQGNKFGPGKVLVMGQIALSLVLVAGAGLMVSTLWKLTSLDAGFERNQVLLVTVNPGTGNYPRERWSAVYQEVLEHLRATPGLRSASVSSITPICHCRWQAEVEAGEEEPDGYTTRSPHDSLASFNEVSDRYFETIGTPFVAGRDFDRHDTASSLRVAVVSQSFARKYFGAANPLGQRIRIQVGRGSQATWSLKGGSVEIVGVVKDARYSSLKDDPSPFVFLPWSQGNGAGPLTSFELRAIAGGPTALIPGAKSAIADVNRNVSIEFQTLSAKTGDSIARERLLAVLSGFFGGLALLLAGIGLYGVMSYNVTRRRNEIGIRIALGAERSRVVRMVMGEAGLLIGIGLAAGLALTIASTRLLAGLLYGVTPSDPLTLSTAIAILAGVAVLAGYLQARRAARLEPLTALREE